MNESITATTSHFSACATLAARGGGIETSFKGDQQGLGLTKRNKKRFEAQSMGVLLGTLAHNVGVWARRWLSMAEGSHCGMLRMVRDVFPISGLLQFDPCQRLVELVLNRHARRAHQLLLPLQKLLAPLIRCRQFGRN